MKVKFNQYEGGGSDISLEPETKYEMQQLMKLAKNAKREPASIRFSFNNDPHCYIFFKHVLPSVQNNSITNSGRR